MKNYFNNQHGLRLITEEENKQVENILRKTRKITYTRIRTETLELSNYDDQIIFLNNNIRNVTKLSARLRRYYPHLKSFTKQKHKIKKTEEKIYNAISKHNFLVKNMTVLLNKIKKRKSTSESSYKWLGTPEQLTALYEGLIEYGIVSPDAKLNEFLENFNHDLDINEKSTLRRQIKLKDDKRTIMEVIIKNLFTATKSYKAPKESKDNLEMKNNGAKLIAENEPWAKYVLLTQKRKINRYFMPEGQRIQNI